MKQVPKASFFNYFSDPKEDEEEDEEDDKEGEDKERTSLTEEEDYEVAHAIRTCLIPDAIMWFTGEAQEGDFDVSTLHTKVHYTTLQSSRVEGR